MSRLKSYFQRQRTAGQSLVELTLFFPILLIMLSGVIEFGFAFNQYINLIEATREGARYAVDGDPCNQSDLPGFDFGKGYCHQDKAHQVLTDESWYPDGYQGQTLLYPGSKKTVYLAALEYKNGVAINDKLNSDGKVVAGGDGKPDPVCVGNNDYYEKVACVVLDSTSPTTLDPARDDVLISVYRVYSDSVHDTTDLLTPGWPNVVNDNKGVDVGNGTNRGNAIDPALGDYAGVWRLWGNANGLGPGGSKFSNTTIRNYFNTYIAQKGQSAGVVVVELWHRYNWVMGLPWITTFLGDHLDFYTYTIVPVPAGEPKPTLTDTPTPTNTPTVTNTLPPQSPTATQTLTPVLVSATPTSTETPTPTPTNTETPTPTPTVTVTPVCSGPQVPDSNLSTVSRTVSPVWANGWPASRIVVTLVDQCGNMITGWDPAHDHINFQISSSRGTADTIIWEGDVNNIGQYSWTVGSLSVGTSTYSVQVYVNSTVGWATLVQHPDNTSPSVSFVCIDGVGEVGYNAQSVQFAYSNPDLGTIRRVISAKLEFTPRVGATGPFTVTTIAWGSTGNVIWAGPQAVSSGSPLNIGSGGWNGPGTGGRSIVMGVTKKPMLFSLGYGLANSGVYTLTTTWDDGTGTNICTSDPVVYRAIP